MKKQLLKIIGIIILMIAVALGVLIFQGHIRCERELEAKSLTEAVEEYTQRADYTAFDELSDDFVNAVISVEDKRFFTRHGYDFTALLRALYNNLQAGDIVEGGSTITEQIAKNLYLDGYVDGLEEKMAEIFIMHELEESYSKEELFALYASMNYYGDGYYGIAAAGEGYYHKRPADLSLAQSAMLAGIPNAPSIYQLSDGYELAKQRQEWVLLKMLENEYISQNAYEKALSEDVRALP